MTTITISNAKELLHKILIGILSIVNILSLNMFSSVNIHDFFDIFDCMFVYNEQPIYSFPDYDYSQPTVNMIEQT